MPVPPTEPNAPPQTRFAPLRRGMQPLFERPAHNEPPAEPNPAAARPAARDAIEDGTAVPDPAETRPIGTGDVVADTGDVLGPWQRRPLALFEGGAPAASLTAAASDTDAAVPAPNSEGAIPYWRRQPPRRPTPLPKPKGPAVKKPRAPSSFGLLALWKDAPGPLFRQPGAPQPGAPGPGTLSGAPSGAGTPGAAMTVAPAQLRPPAPTLVTGATGFVGSAVARALLADGHTLRVLVRPGSNRGNLEGLQAEIAEGDLTDPASLAAALTGCRYLVHVAADYRLWVPDPAAMHATNVDGTRALLMAARDAGVERIVYCSSVAALGLEGDGTPGTEDTPVNRDEIIGAYKQSKYDAEQLVRAMAADGVPVVIVAPSAPVGPRDRKPTPTGKMILDAAAGRMPAYVPTGLNIVHVDDVAHGHVLALDRGQVGETYILGGEDLGMAHLLAIIDDVMGRPEQKRTRLSTAVLTPVAMGSELKARVFGTEPRVTREMLAMADKQMFYSSAKARDDLGYTARPARQAVADAVAWFRQAGMLRD